MEMEKDKGREESEEMRGEKRERSSRRNLEESCRCPGSSLSDEEILLGERREVAENEAPWSSADSWV